MTKSHTDGVICRASFRLFCSDFFLARISWQRTNILAMLFSTRWGVFGRGCYFFSSRFFFFGEGFGGLVVGDSVTRDWLMNSRK